tara:strand:- start:848 stop:2209 length:1362 start_codon:yes stop_codon:yes gene_type:complete
MINDLLILLGRLHPLIIHLPIGFIVLGLLIELNKKKLAWSGEAIKYIFFWSFITGIFSIFSGYFQYEKGGYLWETIQFHLIAGISTVLLSFGFYLYLSGDKYLNYLPRKFYTVGHFVLLTVTGHLGGNITHGEEHLVEPIKNIIGLEVIEDIPKPMKYSDYENETVYTTLIKPIIDNKCVKCHNQNKSKGGLKMHTQEALVKGGRNGAILNFLDPAKSEMIKRIHLPKGDKKHMPPIGSNQLSRQEIEILDQWVSMGVRFDQTVEQFELNQKLIDYFFNYKESFFPENQVDLPNMDLIKELKKRNILINPIFKMSNFLEVSTINNKKFSDADLRLLQGIENNIVSLDLSNSAVTDSIFFGLNRFLNLTILKLKNTRIEGRGISRLQNLNNLKRINLVNSMFQNRYIDSLMKITTLEKVYLYSEHKSFKRSNDSIFNKIIDFGYNEFKNLNSSF